MFPWQLSGLESWRLYPGDDCVLKTGLLPRDCMVLRAEEKQKLHASLRNSKSDPSQNPEFPFRKAELHH